VEKKSRMPVLMSAWCRKAFSKAAPTATHALQPCSHLGQSLFTVCLVQASSKAKPCVSAPLICPPIHSSPVRFRLWHIFWTPSLTLSALLELCCFMKLHVGPRPSKQGEQDGLKTLHIRVAATQLCTAPVPQILELPHAAPSCHRSRHTCLFLLLHIRASSPRHFACFVCSWPPWFLIAPQPCKLALLMPLLKHVQCGEQ